MTLRNLCVGALAVGTFVASLGIVALADVRSMRHSYVNNSADCYVSQIENFPPTTNAIFLGTSRVRRGIDAELAAEISGGILISPINLGRPNYSSVRGLAILMDVLRTDNGIEHVFFEFQPDRVEDGRANDVFFTHDIGTATLARQDYHLLFSAAEDLPLTQRLRSFLDIELTKVRTSIFRLVSGEWFDTVSGGTSSAASVCWKRSFDRPNQEAKLAERLEQMQSQHGDWEIAERRFRQPRTGMQKLDHNLASLVQQMLDVRGIEVTFSRLPAAFEPPISTDAMRNIQSRWETFVAPERGTLIGISDDGFTNPGHMNAKGREIYTRWIVEQMIAGR